MTMITAESINPLALPSLPLADRRQLPNCAAVYLVLEGETVIYVGQSASLILRWRHHGKLKQLKSRGTEIKVAWLECSDQGLLKSIENALIQWFNPELNEVGKRKTILLSEETSDTTTISVKVPVGMKDEIRNLADGDLSTWVREAIREKLERQKVSALGSQVVS